MDHTGRWSRELQLAQGSPTIANIATMSTTIVISTGMRLIVATSLDVSGTTNPCPVVQYSQV